MIMASAEVQWRKEGTSFSMLDTCGGATPHRLANIDTCVTHIDTCVTQACTHRHVRETGLRT